jgi:competence protein ComEC
MNIWTKTPFFRFTLLLCIGIVLGYKYPDATLYFTLSICSFFLFITTLIVPTQYRYYLRWLEGFSLYSFLFFIGAHNAAYVEESRWIPWNKKERINFMAEIIDQPEERKSTIKCPVMIYGTTIKTPPKIILYIAKDTIANQLKDGDKLLVINALFDVPHQSNNKDFDYQRYLEIKGYSGSLYIAKNQWRKLNSTPSFSLARYSRKIREKIINQLKQWKMNEREFGVLTALVLGDKRMLDKETQTHYSTTGASHILAVSGLHVGVVFFIFTFALKLIFRTMKWEKFRILVSLLFLWIYTFITGLPPSVIRASTMLTIAAFSTLLHRRTSIYNSIFASAFLMLLYNPNYLFDISFQLSYLALLSILLFQNSIYRMYRFKSLPDKIWSLLSVSLSAQIGTLPLTLYCFQQFSNYFWFSGLIVVPLSGIIIYLAFGLIILGDIPILSNILAKSTQISLSFMNDSIEWISKLPFSSKNNIEFNGIDLTILYLIVLLILGVLIEKKFRYTLCLLIVLFVYTIYRATYQFFL